MFWNTTTRLPQISLLEAFTAQSRLSPVDLDLVGDNKSALHKSKWTERALMTCLCHLCSLSLHIYPPQGIPNAKKISPEELIPMEHSDNVSQWFRNFAQTSGRLRDDDVVESNAVVVPGVKGGGGGGGCMGMEAFPPLPQSNIVKFQRHTLSIKRIYFFRVMLT